jgi:DNA-binding CsgD family transcriptional regulator
LAEGCVEKRTRLAAALGARFWNMSSPSEGRGWLERGLAGGVALPAALRAKVLNELGFIAMCLGDYPRMTETLEEGLALSRELGDERGIAMSLGPLRFAALHDKDHERVLTLDLDAETGYREVGDPWARGYLAIALGFAAAECGDFERSTELHEEALALFRELGDLRSIAMCLNALGMTALERGSYELARPLFEEDLRLLSKLREKVGIQQGLMGMAAVFGARGDPARAARLWGAEEALREALGLPLWGDFPTPYGYEGRLAAARSLMDEASWEEAWAQGRAMTPEEAIEYALSSKEPTPVPKQPSIHKPADELTRREKEVALLVVRGLTNRQISSELAISENTVANHVARILKKLNLPSRSRIAVWVTEKRLRSPG